MIDLKYVANAMSALSGVPVRLFENGGSETSTPLFRQKRFRDRDLSGLLLPRTLYPGIQKVRWNDAERIPDKDLTAYRYEKTRTYRRGAVI